MNFVGGENKPFGPIPTPMVEIGGSPPVGMLLDGACITRGDGKEDGKWTGVRRE
jgi:hypothetical protein